MLWRVTFMRYLRRVMVRIKKAVAPLRQNVTATSFTSGIRRKNATEMNAMKPARKGMAMHPLNEKAGKAPCDSVSSKSGGLEAQPSVTKSSRISGIVVSQTRCSAAANFHRYRLQHEG